MNDMDRSALRRVRAACERFLCLALLVIRVSKKRPGQEETAGERARAAERVRNAMFLTKFGPFTGPASDKVLGMELRDGHKRPQRDPKHLNSLTVTPALRAGTIRHR